MAYQDFVVAPGIAPAWLLGPTGTALLKSMGQAMDTLQTKFANGAEAHMPTKCDPSALPLIGNDRLMPQGPSEAVASYRTRLKQSISVWGKLAGTPWGVERAALSVLLPSQPRIRHVTNTSAWDTYDQSAIVTNPPYHAFQPNGANWSWDGSGSTYADPSPPGINPWWRFWLVLYATGVPWCTSSGKWGSSGLKWGDPSKSWGFSTPSAIFQLIQTVVRQWKSEHSWCRWIIVSFDDTLFNPWLGIGGGVNPDGTFGRWSKIVNGQYVQSRFTNARYLDCPAPSL